MTFKYAIFLAVLQLTLVPFFAALSVNNTGPIQIPLSSSQLSSGTGHVTVAYKTAG